jgi:uncharacterized OB-fold protein
MIPQRPIPTPNSDTLPFWEGCKRGELLYQECGDCRHAQFYPRQICVRCHGTNLIWRQSARQGSIHSFTVVYRAPTPAFKSLAPYIIALVDLDEGFRMMVNVMGEPQACRIDGRVRIRFEDVDGTSLPIGEQL